MLFSVSAHLMCMLGGVSLASVRVVGVCVCVCAISVRVRVGENSGFGRRGF